MILKEFCLVRGVFHYKIPDTIRNGPLRNDTNAPRPAGLLLPAPSIKERHTTARQGDVAIEGLGSVLQEDQHPTVV